MAFPLVFDPAAVTTALMGAYAVLNNPIVKRLLDKAADATGEEAGKQALQMAAKALKKQTGRVMNGVKAAFGVEAARQLETVTPDNVQTIQQVLEKEIKASSQPISEDELAQLLEEIETLREETGKLAGQMQTHQVQVNQSHSGSWNNINIQAFGDGDAFADDKIMGNKTVVEMAV